MTSRAVVCARSEARDREETKSSAPKQQTRNYSPLSVARASEPRTMSAAVDAVAAGVAAVDVASGDDAHAPPPAAAEDGGEQVVTPWDVAGGADGKIDYAKLVDQFGCQTIDAALVERIERVTNTRAHPFLRRGMFFAHRELDQIVSAYERGEKFYL